jgi:hypothetical protein
MLEEATISPNATDSKATVQPAAPSLESIAEKMAVMRDQTQRNLLRKSQEQAATGDESSVDSDYESEVADPDASIEDANQHVEAQDAVSDSNVDTSSEELIDFIEFAETNPTAKFKFMRNGREIVIDAKKAAAILGQGGAIHEEARQLKVERAEFEEYLNETRARQEGLALAMEFTVEPKLQKAYDEIIRVQQYQTTFQQQLAQAKDPAQQARIRASMDQNERYIRQQQDTIQNLKPAVDQFRQIRSQQVAERLDHARRSFQDKELRNEYVFNELKEKVSKVWPQAKMEIVPGVANIDLISSDETIMSLIRDGLKYRGKPTAKSAGASMAALTSRRGASTPRGGQDGDIEKLRAQAKSGDKKAADNLLVAQLQKLRAGRGGR